MKLGNYTRRFNFFLLLTLFIFQIIDNYRREVNIAINLTLFKTILLLIIAYIFLLEFIYLKKYNRLKIEFTYELKCVIKLAICFAILSGYFIIKNNGFEFETVIGLIKILLPIFVAFEVINIMTFKDIYKLLTIILVISIFSYILVYHDVFSLQNIKSINLLSSYSPFESNFFSPVAISLCIFFCYFGKNKFLKILSILFTLMTFKRIMVLYSIFLLLFGNKIVKWKSLPKWVSKLFIVFFTIICIVYIQLMLGNIDDFIYKFIGINVSKFTMGRSYFMREIVVNFKSLGFMSSTVDYRSMEMDLPMIYTEMGILSVIATIYYFTKLAKDNCYIFLMIVFCLLELLTSHFFDITYFWIITYITIGCIQYKKDEYMNIQKQIKYTN